MQPPRMRAIISSLALICVLVGDASAQEGATRYVVADVMRVRAAPDKGAKVIANLRIATQVKVTYDGTAPGGWSKVTLDTDPPLTGYLASAFLNPEPPKAADLLARYEAAVAAGNLDDAKTAAERLVALQPDTDEFMEWLKALYLKLGDTERAQRINVHLKGEGVKYIGFCGGPLLAAYQPGKGLAPWVAMPVGGGPAIKGGLPNGLRALQRSPWFQFDADRSLRSLAMHGTFLLKAKVLPPKPGQEDMLWGGRWIDLPVCGTRGSILSNEPMEPVPFEPADWQSTIDIVEKQLAQQGYQTNFLIDSLKAWVIPGPRPLLTVQAGTFSIRRKKYVPREPYMYAGFWELFDQETGKRLAHAGWYGPGPGYGFVNVYAVTWFKWRRSNALVAVVRYRVEGDSGDVGDRISVHVIEADYSVHRVDLMRTWSVEP